MSINEKVFIIGTTLLFVLVPLYMLISITDVIISTEEDGKLPSKTILIDCYDENNNQILELTCKDRIVCTKWGLIDYKCSSEKWKRIQEDNQK